MSRRRVVITGMGVISPLGNSIDGFWERLLAGESGVKRLVRFDPSKYPVTFGGECREFQPEEFIDKKQTKRLDRFAQMAIAAATIAARDSGFDFVNAANPERSGVIIGSGIGGLMELEEQHLRLIEKGPDRVSAFTIPKLMVNAASGNISILFNAKGPNTAVATACASATNAMGDALRAIQFDFSDVMITGGSEAALTPLGLAAFAAMKALSERNDAPEKASRPFDKSRDGFVMGEGAGVFIFEEFQHARKRNARIYGEVLGFGMSGDACHITQPDECGRGAALAMSRALTDAQVRPDSIDYVNAHGTGTPLGDVAETVAIKSVFGPHATKLAVSSTKSAIGHLLGASGAVELAATVLALRHGIVPPTINLDEPDPQCDLDYVPNRPRDQRVERAINNSFGFGGHNACLVIGRCA
ncbi:MAG: beta-ketoacyl-ACP synthase II [Phycisphaerae bacterium]|nr:beta-ketoacyl-ACP synthase II [Phycisphaerae bacterium]